MLFSIASTRRRAAKPNMIQKAPQARRRARRWYIYINITYFPRVNGRDYLFSFQIVIYIWIGTKLQKSNTLVYILERSVQTLLELPLSIRETQAYIYIHVFRGIIIIFNKYCYFFSTRYIYAFSLKLFFVESCLKILVTRTQKGF